MKSTQEIAQVLLTRRNTMNPVVMQGEMLLALEPDGLQEALQRRWLVPQMETGYLLISQEESKVAEMREIVERFDAETAAKQKKEGKDEDDKEGKKKEWTKPWERPNESRQFAMNHSGRNISELLSPGTGHDSGGPLSNMPTPAATPTGRPPMPPAAPPPAAPMPSASSRPPSAPNAAPQPGGPTAPGKVGIGNNVMVQPAAESQTYTGKVTKAANGMVTVAFGNTEREFPENEVKVVGT